MRGELLLVTGATGMIGRAIAERAVAEGYRVRASVRASSDRRHLDALGVEVVEADLTEPESLPALVAGVGVVVHAAAHLGDWGPYELYRDANLVAVELLLAAVTRAAALRRFIHISTTRVCPLGDHYGTDESVPIDRNGYDGYTRTKAEAELVVQRYLTDHRVPAVILRPGSVYGPGDRTVLPRLLEKFAANQMKFIGDGKAMLNNTSVDNFVDAVMLAIDKDAAVGEVFNVRDERLVDRLEYINTVADYLGRPHPPHVPLWLARAATPLIEGLARLAGAQQAPLLTAAQLNFMTSNLDFSIDKARRILGYQPRVDFRDGMRAALDWATGKAPQS